MGKQANATQKTINYLQDQTAFLAFKQKTKKKALFQLFNIF